MLAALASAAVPPLPWVAPFALLLLAIAVLPLAAPHFWESNRNKALVVGAIAAPVLLYLLAGDPRALGHALGEYLSFIALLSSLYVISSGVLIGGDLRATPLTNAAILLVGALVANLVGTTGASMLLIRPLLRINSERKRVAHTVVFFIFAVSNIGGCLTPLGDPPLFLGYLRGVPFTWTLRLWPEWLFALGATLAAYVAVDTWQWRRERPEERALEGTRQAPIRVHGKRSFLFLGAVLAATAFVPSPAREVAMVLCAWIAFRITPDGIHHGNHFSFGPIIEVIVLFAGIFVAMVPALQVLEARGGSLGIREPWQFFVATGSLSSLLDNAPTYLSFVSVAKALHATHGQPGELVLHIDGDPVPESLLVAISLGAVFMGAMTYIGNGPNFMVKAIAEARGIRMPSFFGYMGWSIPVLGPILAALTVIFLL